MQQRLELVNGSPQTWIFGVALFLFKLENFPPPPGGEILAPIALNGVRRGAVCDKQFD